MKALAGALAALSAVLAASAAGAAPTISGLEVRPTHFSPDGDGIQDGAGGFTYILSLDYRDGVLYAGGNFSRAGASEANNIAVWDGTGWVPLGSGTDSTVGTVAVRDDALFATGAFALAGGRPSVQIARYSLAK